MAKHVEPIMLKKLSFKKSALMHLKVLAGLDRGCSLTKIIYVDKSDADQLKNDSKSELISLTLTLFLNTDFDEALVWLKERAYFPEDKSFPIHSTGAGGVKFSEQIIEILERDVIFIDEFMAQSRGAYYLLKHAPLEEIVFPEIETDCTDVYNVPIFNDIKIQFEEHVGKRKEGKGDLLPFAFGFIGSGGGFTNIGSDGSFRMLNSLPAGGKTFIGISKCILGTNNYEEITAMAARGDRRKVDTQITDNLIEEHPYDVLRKELPIFHLGKLAETKKSIQEFNKDDIARSLVSLFMYNALSAAIHVCLSEKVFTVIFGGNLYQGEIFRKEFSALKKVFRIDFINVHFLNNGHAGALGAMMCFPTDMDKYCKIQ